jgi:hypothetical protein
MSWEDDALPPPADPWAGAPVTTPNDPTAAFAVPDPTLEMPVAVPQTYTAADRTTSRPVYGAIYCLITATDPRKYVGKSGPRVSRDGRRLRCAPGIRVDEHRDTKDWGHEILPGRRGYRVLEWVEESGRGRDYDEANLRYREAVWIQRIDPTENALRPVPVPPEQALARAERLAPAVKVRQAVSTGRARPVAWFRLVSFAFWLVLWTAFFARSLSYAGAGWVPWVFAPVLGVSLAWWTVWEIRRRWDRLTSPRARPPARRRSRRSRRR